MKAKTDTKLDPQAPPPTVSEPKAQRRRLKRLLDQLEAQPTLLAQVEKVLGLAAGGDPAKPLASADTVEGQLVESLRQLGNQTLGAWAEAAQARAIEACRQEHPTARLKKKAP